jgi:hypothetical protein
MERNRLTDYVEEHYPDYTDKILLADGFEDAFIGVVESFGNEPKACYNYDACITILMEGDVMNGEPQMTYDEAVEYMDYNVTGAYVGEHTPAFIMNVALGEQKL